MHGGPSDLKCLLVESVQDSQESCPRGQEHGPLWEDVPISSNAGSEALASLHSSRYGHSCHGFDAIYGKLERRRNGQVWYCQVLNLCTIFVVDVKVV